MTAALEGGEWSAARPGSTLPHERLGIAVLFHDRGTRRG